MMWGNMRGVQGLYTWRSGTSLLPLARPLAELGGDWVECLGSAVSVLDCCPGS